MIIFSLIVLVAIAAFAGYRVGARKRVGTAGIHTPSAALPPSAPVAEVITHAGGSGPGDSTGIASEKARLIRSRDSEAALLRRSLAECTAAACQAEEFARERAQLFGDLADARGTAARYRQLVIDIETNAPPRILGGVGEPDDLKLIVGVGPVLERMLHGFGVATFRQIAHWSERDIAEFDAKLPEFPGRIVRDQWVIQARALHQSKYGEPV